MAEATTTTITEVPRREVKATRKRVNPSNPVSPEGVDIAGGRWAIWPTVSRVSIGSRQEMEGFMAACGKVLSA